MAALLGSSLFRVLEKHGYSNPDLKTFKDVGIIPIVKSRSIGHS